MIFPVKDMTLKIVNLYLKEMELIVLGNIDYNKDKHNIQKNITG
jgi:hypothetical protein